MEGLIRAQMEFLDQLGRAERNLKKANQETRAKSSYLTARMEAVDKLEESFNKNHLDLVSIATKEQKAGLPYFTEYMEDTFQEAVINYKTLIKDYLALTKPSTTEAGEKVMFAKNEFNSEIKLPRIQLPIFTGKYTEWQSFHDLFVSLIHENRTLLPVQKLYYLKTSLSGEPEQFLCNFPTTSANYNEAWEQLVHRYNNKRYNCNAILKTLFSQKSLQYESANSLKELLDTTTSCLKALDNIGINTTEWDTMLVFLVVSKLDTESHRQWEHHVSNMDEDLPKWSHLGKFLEMRYRSLEMVDTNNHSAYPRTKIQTNHSDQAVNVRACHYTLKVKPSRPERLCAMCDGPHCIHDCDKFKMKPVLERQYVAQIRKLCFNCLSSTHPVFKCHKSASCCKCSKKHHTLLHFENKDKIIYKKKYSNENASNEMLMKAKTGLFCDNIIDFGNKESGKVSTFITDAPKRSSTYEHEILMEELKDINERVKRLEILSSQLTQTNRLLCKNLEQVNEERQNMEYKFIECERFVNQQRKEYENTNFEQKSTKEVENRRTNQQLNLGDVYFKRPANKLGALTKSK